MLLIIIIFICFLLRVLMYLFRIWEVVAQGKLPFEEHINDQVMTIKERIVREGLRPIIPPECPPDLGRVLL